MKQTTIIISTIGFILITLNSCNNSGYKYFEGTFPENPVNLKQINSEFDDYNSTIPYLGETFPLCFSSNRNSNGDDYDIIYKFMFIMFSKTNGSLDIIEQTNSDVYEQHLTLNNALNKINTSSDEFGPNIIYHGLNVSETTYTGNYKTFVFLYSNNSNGNQNIMFTHNYANENFEIPIEIEFLNSDYNDAYPTFNKDNSEIYFTSDRNGIYNIHKTEVNNTNGIIAILTDNSIDTIKTDTILSSINNDKCPYILNDFIVFALPIS